MKRVVVTGLGALTPLGNTVADFWDNMVNGVSGAARITKFDPEKFKTQFACEIKNFDLSDHFDRKQIRKCDPFSLYAQYVADQALADSGLDVSTMNPYDIGVIWGSGQGGLTTFEVQLREYFENGFVPRFNPFFVPKLITNMAAGQIALSHGLKGINFTAVSACSTANTAFMDALNYIRLGKAKVIVSGGSESPISEASVGGFNALRALSTNNDNAQSASRPFDVNRDGFVMGEGAGAMILEEYEHAKARGAKIYCELAGASMTADAYHMTATHPDGEGAAMAMELVLKDAGVNKDEVDYINTHATSTPLGDISETKAVASVFGDKVSNIAISATKSMTGHLLGAAGAIEGIAAVQAICTGIIPPTINTTEPDPEIPAGLDIVLGTAREKQVKVAVSNTFGFGGHNGIVLFKAIS